jgi:nitrate/nitrite transporter NarK
MGREETESEKANVWTQDLFFIIFLIDRVGRKKPLLFGTVGITIALICEAIVNSQNEDGTKPGLSIAGVAFLFCVSIIFSLSFGKPFALIPKSRYYRDTESDKFRSCVVGIHERNHALPNPRQGRRLRYRDRELACQHFLGASQSHRLGPFGVEILFLILRYVLSYQVSPSSSDCLCIFLTDAT